MKKNCLYLLIILLLSSCSKDVLDRTIFIPDENDNNLPAYTEWGYNTFGAEFERDYFLVSNSIVPCKISHNNNHLQFSLSGTIQYGEEMTLSFVFPFDLKNKDYKDLIQLHKTEISFPSSGCTIKMLQYGNETILDVLDGKLHFKRAQILSIDDQENRVILSGIFELRFLQDGFPITISNGRFDLGITKNLFYAY